VLIGRALDFLPYFVLSFRELAAKGLGLNRAKCMLNRDEQTGISPNGDGPGNSEGHLIYSAEDQRLRSPNPTSVVEHLGRRLHQFAPSINGSTPRLLTLRFLTPTFLVADGEVIRRPDFHHVFKRLRDRINSLSTFFGDGPLAADSGASASAPRKSGPSQLKLNGLTDIELHRKRENATRSPVSLANAPTNFLLMIPKYGMLNY